MSIPQQKLLDKTIYNKWRDKKRLNQEMAKRMLLAGFEKRSFRMHDCAQKIEITECTECGKYTITKAKLCRDRLCPVCSWRLSVKRYAEMMQVCSALLKDYPRNRWSFLTLTVKNCEPSLLGGTLGKMEVAFNRMRQRKVFQNEVAGWAKTVEVTFNKKSETVHPHFHVLLMWEEDVDVLTSGSLLKLHWEASCKELTVSHKGQHIEDIKGKHKEKQKLDITRSVLETFKYTQKATDLLDISLGFFKDYAVGMENKRTVAFGGLIKEYMKKYRFSLKDEAPEPESVSICSNCGDGNLSQALYYWSFAERSYLCKPPKLQFEEAESGETV